MISVDVCDGKQTECNVPPDRLRELIPLNAGKATRGSNGVPAPSTVSWVDMSAPTPEDWETLKEQFSFHPLALEDAQRQNPQRPKLDVYDGYLFLSIRAWAGVRTSTDDADDVTKEIDVFVGPNYLVTIHEEDSPAIEETRKRLQRNPENLSNKPAYLLYLILDAVVDDYFPAMDELDADIDKVETAIYEAADTVSTDLKPALALKKRLLLLRQTVAPLRDVLNYILRIDDPALVPSELRVFYQDVYDHTLRLTEQIDLHRDILGGVMDALMAQSSYRLNQVMKALTGVSTILMSAALIAGIYGMNFKVMPELHWKYGYGMALTMMVIVAGSLVAYFKKIKWF